MMRQINKNFAFLVQKERESNIRGVVLEGSSRSGKTISGVDFCIYIGATYGGGHVINILKETYNSFKTTLYDDFDKRLKAFGLSSPFDKSKEVSSFTCLGNKINFIGADKESKFQGASCDFLWMNEMLDIEKPIFDQSEMRCRKFWWGDYNPKVTSHYVYDAVIPRDDIGFLHSTFLDNPFISDIERNKILSYEDTEENRRQGTANIYMWKVYGEGIRAAMEGLVHPNVTWINEFPTDCEEEAWGLDFGYTIDPSALVRVGVRGREVFLQNHLYTPTRNSDILGGYLDKILPDTAVVWADSADPGMVNDLKDQSLPVYAVKKFRGSINYGNSLLSKFRINIVRDPDFRKEQENYKYKVLNGKTLNEPDDKWNHLWDATRYAMLGSFMYYGE